MMLSRIAEQVEQEAMEENAAVLSEKLAIVSKLSEVAAHELRNPLGTIKGFLQMMESSMDTPERNRIYLNTISKQVEKIERVSTEFLALANPKLGNKSTIHIESMLNDIKDQIDFQAAIKEIEIEVSCLQEDMKLYGDEEKLGQAVLNIVKNAVEAMNSGCVLLKAQYEGKQIRIDIADNGPGIPRHLIPLIGEPLITEKESGVGLGLVISKKIIAAHDGILTVESEPDKGTTFTLNFPKTHE